MRIILDDTLIKENLYPFTATRNTADIRIGILTIREKWEKIMGYNILVNLAEPFSKNGSQDEMGMPVIMSGNIVPTKKWLDDLLKDGAGEDKFGDEDAVRILKYPEDIFKNNNWALRKDFEL